MTSYRPLTDIWILGRPKSHYYGAYPEGFLWRAKTLVGNGKCIHLCCGKLQPYFPIDKRAILNDDTLDIDSSLNPKFVADATKTGLESNSYNCVLIDPPYTIEDATHYNHKILPEPKDLINEATRIVKLGGRIGFLHYIIPRPNKQLRLLACIGVFYGYDNRMRAFSVFEKTNS